MTELHFWGIFTGANAGFKNDFYPKQQLGYSTKWMTERIADDRTASELLFRRNWINLIDVWNESCAITWFKTGIQTNGTNRPGYTAASLYCRPDQLQSAHQHEASVMSAIDECLQKQRFRFDENNVVQHPTLNLSGVANPTANKYQAEVRKIIVLHNAGTSLSLERLLNILPKLKHKNYSLFLVQDAINTNEKDELQNRLSREEVSFIDGQNNFWNSLKSVLIELIPGCTDPNALNYNPAANVDNGSCVAKVLGCTDPEASNYNPEANKDDGSCKFEVYGCMDSRAANFNPKANVDDGSCLYSEPPLPPQTQSSIFKRIIPFVMTAFVFGAFGVWLGLWFEKDGSPEIPTSEVVKVTATQLHPLDSLMSDFRPPAWDRPFSLSEIDKEKEQEYRSWVNQSAEMQKLYGDSSSFRCGDTVNTDLKNSHLKNSHQAWRIEYVRLRENKQRELDLREAEKKQKEEAERKQKEEAERIQKEEAERKQKEESERKQKEEAERKQKEEAERIQKEESERKQKEEAERKQKEESERKQKEEAERKQKEAAEREQKEEEAEREQKEEEERKQKEEKAKEDNQGFFFSSIKKTLSNPQQCQSNESYHS